VTTQSHEQLRNRVADHVRSYAVSAADAARLTDEVVREIHDDEWEADVSGRIAVARRRLRDAELLRHGCTIEQLEPFRIHYSS
jgi:hypothetical protein